jgi:glutathione reductase (NADPH)
VPEFKGAEYVVTSNEMFFLDSLPSRALVVGGGYIAVEFAGILNGLGVNTMLCYRGERILRGFDEDVGAFAQEEYCKSGIDLRLKYDVESIELLDSRDPEGPKRVNFTNGVQVEVDLILYATGRVPNTGKLNLEAVGIEHHQGIIAVDSNFKTNIQSVYAIGDVINRMQLTPVAIAEAMALIRYWFDGEPVSLDYDNVPTAVFSQPAIGTVGLSEQAALQRGLEIEVYQTQFKPMKHTLSGSTARTFMKLIVDKTTDRVVGAHMVGDYAGEIIQGLGIALKAGATKADFDATIGVHPTSAEEFVTFSAASLKQR